MSKQFFRTKPVQYKARLLKPNYAIFHKWFHLHDYSADAFYQYLQKKSNEQIVTARIEPDAFKYPMSNEGFYFKNDKTSYLDVHGKPCLQEDCLDRDVLITMSVVPYDFEPSPGKRLVGISITAKTVQVKNDVL